MVERKVSVAVIELPLATECYRRPDLPLVRSKIETLKSEIGTYYSTLRESVDTANRGVEFAERAQGLCDYLADRTVSEARIQRHISQMQAIAKLAQRDASRTTERCRNSRMKINEVRSICGALSR